MRLLVLVLCSLGSLVQALHYPLIAPNVTQLGFHYQSADAPAAPVALYALSYAHDESTIASINPKEGSFNWRLQWPNVSRYIAVHQYLLLFSEIESVVTALNGINGQLLWDWSSPAPLQDAFIVKEGQHVLLLSSKQVVKVSTATGSLLWTMDLPPPIQNAASYRILSNAVLAISADGRPTSLSFDHITGFFAEAQPHSISAHLHQESPSVLIVQEEKAVFFSRSFSLQSFCPSEGRLHTYKPSPDTSSTNPFVSMHDIGLASKGYFLIKKLSGAASVLRIKEQAGACEVESAWEFNDAIPLATYSGIIDRNGEVYVMRIHYADHMGLALVSTYSSVPTSFSPKGLVTGSSFPFSPNAHGSLTSIVAAELAIGGSTAATGDEAEDIKARQHRLSRAVLLTTSGSLQLWITSTSNERTPQWSLELGLADLGKEAITWVDVSRDRSLAHGQTETAYRALREGYVERWQRHGKQLVNLVTGTEWSKFAKKEYWMTTSVSKSNQDWLTRSFGFKKLAIIASERGTLTAVDVLSPSATATEAVPIVWQTLGIALNDPRDRVIWKKLLVVDLLQHAVESPKVLIAVAGITTHRGRSESVVFRLNAATGRAIAATTKIFDGPVSTAFALTMNPKLPATSIAAVDSEHRVHVLPAQADSSVAYPSEPFFYHVKESDRTVSGYKIQWPADHSAPAYGQQVWSFALSTSDDKITSIEKQSMKSIASLGKVLGDRSTLYKYLNPHLIAVTSASPSSSSVAVHVIDTVSGATVWSATHSGVRTSFGIQAVLDENWLVYSFVEVSGESTTSRVVSVELYERPRMITKKKKTRPAPYEPRKEGSSFRSEEQPLDFSRAFVVPYIIKQLGITQTGKNIASKALLATTDRDNVININRRLLDPRRPLQKSTKQEMEEGLIPYDPLLPADPKWIISQDKLFLSSPSTLLSSATTILESTSLVLAAGIDLVATRLAVSKTFDVLGEDFNKIQLVLVLLGLTAGIFVTKPMVANNKTKASWYTS